MNVKLYIKTEYKQLYTNHSNYHDGDAGLDIFTPKDYTIAAGATELIDLGISCEMKKFSTDSKLDLYSTLSYFLYPRSSIYKTPLRMANSVGIIDSKYRGNICAAVDNVSDEEFVLKSGTRLFQICAPDLLPFDFVLVDELSKTSRGNCGFGSTG
jgi:dUTP pyrophosphatase